MRHPGLAERSALSMMGLDDAGTQAPEVMPSYGQKGRPLPVPMDSTQDENHILSRLKRRTSPNHEEPAASSSQAVNSPKNALDRMMNAANHPREKRPAGKSNLLDEQAEESDEDNGWLPNGGAEDEDEDDDQDGYVQDLLNDEHVGEEESSVQNALAAEKAR